MIRPSWDETWLKVCEVMAERATCTRRQVGAVVVRGNRLISSGYNGSPPAQPHCIDGACPRGRLTGDLPEDYEKYPCTAVHAEANALLRAGREAEGATLYCTHKPCLQCQNLIMGAKVFVVVYPVMECIRPREKFPHNHYWNPAGGLIK